MAHRIAILWHERQLAATIADYAIAWYANTWRAAGLDVVHVFGVDTHVPADVAIVHVDLSVVPDRYLDFARRYPVVLNGRLSDIRKSAYSDLRLSSRSEYAGHVIVKTNRNHGGRPERRLARLRALRQGPSRWQRRRTVQWTRNRAPYHVYEHLDQVPRRYFADPRFIVERLVSEQQEGMFWTRYLNVLGDRLDSYRICADNPIVTGVLGLHAIESDPRLVAYARTIGLEYGKIDYVVHDGTTHVLDINKTTGAGVRPLQEVFLAGRHHRAAAIYDLLPVNPESFAGTSRGVSLHGPIQ
ncbi:MAG: hypothetical protein ACJ735_03940 [Actinomycetes bacterium]